MRVLERHLQLGDWFSFPTKKPDNCGQATLKKGQGMGDPLSQGSLQMVYSERHPQAESPNTSSAPLHVPHVSSTFIELSSLSFRMAFY